MRKNTQSFSKRLSQIQKKIDVQYEGTVDRLIDRSKQIDWIKANYDKFTDDMPRARKNITHDLSLDKVKSFQRKNSIKCFISKSLLK